MTTNAELEAEVRALRAEVQSLREQVAPVAAAQPRIDSGAMLPKQTTIAGGKLEDFYSSDPSHDPVVVQAILAGVAPDNLAELTRQAAQRIQERQQASGRIARPDELERLERERRQARADGLADLQAAGAARMPMARGTVTVSPSGQQRTVKISDEAACANGHGRVEATDRYCRACGLPFGTAEQHEAVEDAYLVGKPAETMTFWEQAAEEDRQAVARIFGEEAHI